jgi:hypothetical protein
MAVSALLVMGVMASSPPAWASAPANDNRVDAVTLTPPQTVTGTLVESTLEAVNDPSCYGTDGSVWYGFEAPATGEIVIQLDAAGQMDATMDFFKVDRSKLDPLECQATDSQGNATIDRGGLEAGATYALRIGNQIGSVADTFQLRVLVPTPPPTPPGRHLPSTGVRNRVDRVLNSAEAYWTSWRAGRTMRLSLFTDRCTSLRVFGPGTKSFTADPALMTSGCGGFSMITPRQTGRYYLVVAAARDRAIHHYVLKVAPARADDIAPGILIHNHAAVRSSVNGRLDSRDLYRFDVVRRSALTLRLSGNPTMTLLSADGDRLGSGDLISRHVRAGRYYVAVSGDGSYTLRYAAKTITRAHLLVNGRQRATLAPDRAAHWQLRVTPRVKGPSVITVERFDPIEGWQFMRTFNRLVRHGTARVTWTPPSVGRYRAYATYLGSRNAAPADSGLAWLTVQRPLSQ